PENIAYDAARSAHLELRGLLVARCRNDEVCEERLRELIRELSSRPPSPQSGEGTGGEVNSPVETARRGAARIPRAHPARRGETHWRNGSVRPARCGARAAARLRARVGRRDARRLAAVHRPSSDAPGSAPGFSR